VAAAVIVAAAIAIATTTTTTAATAVVVAMLRAALLELFVLLADVVEEVCAELFGLLDHLGIRTTAPNQ